MSIMTIYYCLVLVIITIYYLLWLFIYYIWLRTSVVAEQIVQNRLTPPPTVRPTQKTPKISKRQSIYVNYYVPLIPINDFPVIDNLRTYVTRMVYTKEELSVARNIYP